MFEQLERERTNDFASLDAGGATQHLVRRPRLHRAGRWGRVTEQLVIDWFETLCEALDALHVQGWVHGDVSLSNILVDEAQIVLIDYDLAGPIGYQPRSQGTVLYASPERRDGAEILARDDVYSLAATLFHAITNRPPAPAKDGLGLDWTNEERAAFPALVPLLDRAAGPADRRFVDAGAALRELRACASIYQQSAPAADAVSAAPEPLRPNEVARVKDILSTYPGSRFGNAETRGLDTEFAFDTYVPTALDTELPAAIAAGDVALGDSMRQRWRREDSVSATTRPDPRRRTAPVERTCLDGETRGSDRDDQS